MTRRGVLGTLPAAFLGVSGDSTTNRQLASPDSTVGATRSPTGSPTGTDSFQQATKIAPDDGDPVDKFGGSIALDGETALTSAGGSDPAGTDTGAVYVFVRNGGGWTQETKLAPDDGDDKDFFGVQVDLHGDRALISAPFDEDPNGKQAGSAYVFVREGDEWTQEAKLAPDDGDRNDFFGDAVAIHGDTALVGASHDEDPNGKEAGSAYVFQRPTAETSSSPPLLEVGAGLAVTALLSGGWVWRRYRD